jgi:hypothetical protein
MKDITALAVLEYTSSIMFVQVTTDALVSGAGVFMTAAVMEYLHIM